MSINLCVQLVFLQFLLTDMICCLALARARCVLVSWGCDGVQRHAPPSPLICNAAFVTAFLWFRKNDIVCTRRFLKRAPVLKKVQYPHVSTLT